MTREVNLSALLTTFDTLVDLLRSRAQYQPHQAAYTFLLDGQMNIALLTYAALAQQARAIAAMLLGYASPGDRVLLLYPPGLEYIAAFFGCLYIGAVAVPAYPPDSARLERTLPRLQAIVQDARPRLLLTTAAITGFAPAMTAHDRAFGEIRWLAIDTLADDLAES